METIVLLVLCAGLLAAASLFMGVLSMAVGGEFDERNSVRLMAARVGSQATALALMVVAVVLA